MLKPATGSATQSTREALPLVKELPLEAAAAGVFVFQEMQGDLNTMLLLRAHPGASLILPLIESHPLQESKGV